MSATKPNQTLCKTCKAPVYWGVTKNGKPCQYDDPETKNSHFMTCPQASSHSKKAKKGKAQEPSDAVVSESNPSPDPKPFLAFHPEQGYMVAPPFTGGVTGHICINLSGEKQEYRKAWGSDLQVKLKQGSKVQQFKTMQSGWAPGEIKDDMLFDSGKILVNPYLPEFFGDPILGQCFDNGQFCFKHRGWFVVASLFDVEVITCG